MLKTQIILLLLINLIHNNFPCFTYFTVEENDIHFYYKSQNHNKNARMSLETMSVDSFSKTLVIIIHGWQDSVKNAWMRKMQQKFLDNKYLNTFIMDWAKIAQRDYVTSAIEVDRVGQLLGEKLLKLYYKGMDLKDIHLVGHSLGAQISGSAGRYVYKETGKRIGRITGLDAAKPLFSMALPKMEKGDALKVILIHTDGEQFGYLLPHGDVDFYPNGGVALQPGCPLLPQEMIVDFWSLSRYVGCSHERSIYYFIDSIGNHDFHATKCNSWCEYLDGDCKNNEVVKFGLHVEDHAKGTYFLKTTSSSPFRNV